MAVVATPFLAVGCYVFDINDCTAGDVLPESLPDGRVGQAYFVQLDVEASGRDCGKPKYEPVGELPPGMKLSRDGALDGTPTEAGTFRVGVYIVLLSRPSLAGDIPEESTGKFYDLTIHPR